MKASERVDNFTVVSRFHWFVEEDMSVNEIKFPWEIHHAYE